MVNSIPSSVAERSISGEPHQLKQAERCTQCRDELVNAEESKRADYTKQLAIEREEERIAIQQEKREDLVRAEEIALKLAGGEKLTVVEVKLIAEKFPDLFYEAQSAKRIAVNLVSELKDKDKQQMKEQVIVQGIQSLVGSEPLNSVQARIRLEAIRYAEQLSEGISILPYFSVPPGTILDDRY